MMNSSIPDSIDCLNLAGVLPYDAKTFIKDGVQVSLNSQKNDPKKIMTGITSDDSFVKNEKTPKETKKKSHNKFKKFSTSLLAASLLFASALLLNKKCPRINTFAKNIDTNIKKVAEPVIKEADKFFKSAIKNIKKVFNK